MILKTGTSGFGLAAAENTLDEKDFKGQVFALARKCGFEVLQLDTELRGKSFYWALLKKRNGQRVYFLKNAFTGYCAFAESVEGKIEFCDEACCPEAMSKAELSDLPEGAFACLAEDELKQIAYWKPRSIGEVIFNNWD